MKRAPAIFLSLFLTASSLCAQEIVAGLSSNRAQVGEPVQLVVTVRGARGADVPETLSVNGLRINLAGRSTQFEMRNFKMSSTLTYTYIIVPQLDGEFTIPSFDVSIEKKIYRTQAMRLSVSGRAGAPQAQTQTQGPAPMPPTPMPPGPEPSAPDNGRPFFGDLVLAKKSAYVGEVIPIELRFYFHARIGGQVGERPNFSGEGFTVQKFSNAAKREQVVNEANYVAFTFQSAITPVKAGVLDIPAASLEARLQVPGKAPQGFDSFFSNFPLPQGMFTETQDVKIETTAQKLDVLALPKEDRPEDFSGAVGKFTMEAAVSPKKAGGGEPVTLRVMVSGRGNFEGMGAPVLTGDEGWRTYPPSDKFHSADAIGFTGEKTFEFPLIARQDQTRTPGIRFSYFDPSTGKYVTLTQEPLAVDARAGAAVPAAPQQQAAGTAATPPPASAPTPDITAMSGGASNWTALFFRKEFLAVHAALALAWLAAVIIFTARRFSASEAGRALARKKRARQALARLAGADPASFYEAAVHFLALRFNVPGDQPSLAEKIASSNFPEEIQSALHRIVARHVESKFAAGGAAPPSAEERERVLATLQEIRHEK
ncbi:MAG: BatD family protein [Verrucomicrobiae bacterium]